MDNSLRGKIENIIKLMAKIILVVGIALMVIGFFCVFAWLGDTDDSDMIIALIVGAVLLVFGLLCLPGCYCLWAYGELVGNSIRADQKLSILCGDRYQDFDHNELPKLDHDETSEPDQDEASELDCDELPEL